MLSSIYKILLISLISMGVMAQNKLPHTSYFTLRNGLKNTFQAIENKQITVAFLGGSITHNKGWRTHTCQYLQERFPDAKFRFIAAGIPSLGSLPHAFRLQRDVLDSAQVDLLFVETAVNDRANGTDSLTQVRALEGIVQHARRSNPKMDIVLMAFADPDKNRIFAQGKIPAEVANHELVASHYQLPSINLAKEVYDRIQNKEFSWEKDFKDLHPSPFGQALYFATIKALIENACSKNNSLKISKLPKKPLNAASLDKGKYYDIKNATPSEGWTLDKNWTPTDGLPTRTGFVQVPMLIGTTPQKPLTMTFKGTAVGIAIISGTDAGILEYAIDNEPFKKIDLFTQWSNQLHLPWYLLLGAGLSHKTHALTLQLSPNHNPLSKGTTCRIVHFLVNE